MGEHGSVVLMWDQEAWGLKAGEVGTVVQVYPHGGYLVEFVDHERNTLALLDLSEAEVAPLTGPARLRARGA
ncbi:MULTISPECIES: DUF4926 domain-containing protein [Thermus]|uniref:DUF4926 domain-containing protein n=1 Tax=Thermus TaxID=270 RepID=UPI001FA998F9|nr:MULTISPECIES: DUF4926 domain-containing protein [Thermus]